PFLALDQQPVDLLILANEVFGSGRHAGLRHAVSASINSRSDSSVARRVSTACGLICRSIHSRTRLRSSLLGKASSSTLSPANLWAWVLPSRLVGRVGSR